MGSFWLFRFVVSGTCSLNQSEETRSNQSRQFQNVGITATAAMFSVFRLLLGSLSLLAAISIKYYPQGGLPTLNQTYQGLARFRDAHVYTRKVAELFICPNYLAPDECKNATDDVFEMVSRICLILQELWMRFAEFLETSISSGTVQKINHDTVKKGAVDFTQGTLEIKGEEQKAERVIKSLQFANYDESNLCDIKEGIPPSEYDVTVDEIADLTNMPEKLKNTKELRIYPEMSSPSTGCNSRLQKEAWSLGERL